MVTDSVAVLKHGVLLGQETWQRFLAQLGWTADGIDRVICHQVGSGHQEAILKSLQVPRDKDYTTYAHLGNMGTAALPVTAAIAHERGVLKSGQRVAVGKIALLELDPRQAETVALSRRMGTLSLILRSLVDSVATNAIDNPDALPSATVNVVRFGQNTPTLMR